MDDLLSKLKSLGMIIHPSEIKNNQKAQIFPLDTFYNGTWYKNNAGKVFIMEKTVPYGTSHGIIQFSKNFSVDPILDLSGHIPQNEFHLHDIIFLDIETTSLSIGAGSFPFLVGLCYFSSKGVKTILLFIETPNDEDTLLAFLNEKLSKYSIICTYNGKSFDIPLLKNRYIMHRMQFTDLPKHHIDLLYFARKIWKMRLKTCKLSDIERKILKLTRSDDEIPGWLVPQIYFDYLDQDSPQILKGVFYHNEIDVLSLAALFQHINKLITNSGNMDGIEGTDLVSLARTYQLQEKLDLSTCYYKFGIKKGFSAENSAFIHRNFGLMNKKQRKWDEAVEQWKLAAEFADYISCIELAKYLEHDEKSYAQALKWPNLAIEII
ncbi:MAG: ribonuclease H-like domain-containing protein, partial [Promethearchaeota archaeon]